MFIKKFFLSLCAALLFAGSSAALGADTVLSIATGGEAGVYYPLGAGLAKVLSAHVPGVKAEAKASDASVANVNMIAGREAELALVQNDVAFRAVRGQRPFKQPVSNLSMIASLYPEHMQCVTKRGAAQTISGLRGKRVSVGAAGSGAVDDVKAVLSSAGIRYAEINADFLDFASTAQRIQAGQLDAGFVLAGYPTSAVTELGANTDIDLVSFEEELLNKLSESYPFFTPDVIPAGTYAGVDHDTPTIAVMAALVCDSDLPEDLVYAITKAIFENLGELAPSHPKAEAISLEKALAAPAVKVHPGAAKYYEEKGLEVPKL